GVVSINLPLCAQQVGAKATRTTHPRVLAGFGRLFTLVLGKSFQVHNPFLWDTKEDVLRRLKKAMCVPLVRDSLSCSHTRQFTYAEPQCGLCSQCLSRRVAVVGAGLGEHDPTRLYRANPLLGRRDSDANRILAERFVGKACLVETMTELEEFYQEFAGEISQVTRFLGLSNKLGAEKLYDLHSRHSKEVGRVMKTAMEEALELRRTGLLEESCVVNYAFDSGQGRTQFLEARIRQDAAPRDTMKLLHDRHRQCIQALFDHNVIGPNGECPSQAVIAEWV